ncbi:MULTISPECIES: N-acetylneuraminate synthase family protein [Kocuria]|uniref:N-acetylneuraminate synthase family protein n=1 Tax=Kocuria TaxID=57493 RepID=UPI0022F139E6|nr:MULTISPECIES: N-acetylneuraminate synthase family protein [Kocuria]MDA4829606.1 N-acetylneuraminate synthase family protein [Kocuria rhizophila]MDN3461811.1 N-acetylneuraminate synthase family protein [Kocuria sp. APC 4018]WSY88572.1 N-acetylneuraminate synthase family protein [Kocuria rhizophila]WSZ54000.1 N-acetylneuraminate synthase family protein [Kocuria rhizophila]
MTAETDARARRVADGTVRRRAPEPVREPGGGELRIGRHTVGAGHPALLIAEIGNNHNGSVALAKHLVDLAQEAGADAVKFQLRDLDALYRQAGAASDGEDLGVQYTLDLLSRFSLDAAQMLEVLEHCRARDIDALCTPWDPPSVQVLAQYGVPAFKIASADLTHHGLLRDAGSRGVPLIVSTGMSSEDEILDAVAVLREVGAPFALLQCQSTYPAPYKDLNIAYMDRLAELGGCPVGYSGHERGSHVPVAAVARGAHIVEKHFTVDRDMEGNDHAVSLLPHEFAQMVEQIRQVEQAIGTAEPRRVTPGESMNRVNLATSLVAARTVAQGERVRAEDVTVRSPGRGLQPDRMQELVGRRMHRTVAEGDFFYPGDLRREATRARTYRFDRPWGIPVRYHDARELMGDREPDFLEFHFSARDLDLDPASVFTGRLPTAFTTHLPDLFPGDFVVDLASPDPATWERSIAEVQRTIHRTRELVPFFEGEQDPLMVLTMGGFTRHGHIPESERARGYERIGAALARLDSSGVRLTAQTLPPFPWLLGGQWFHNLFVDPRDTAEFSRAFDVPLTLDVSHSQLAATFLDLPFADAVDLLAPRTAHLHVVDATGVDGEGVQVGEGDVDFADLARRLSVHCPDAGFIPEIWMGHVDGGHGFWTALERLERWF